MVSLAMLGVCMKVWADVSVYDVKIQPRMPWNGLVDISYSVACDNPNADVYVTPTAYDGDRRITLFPKTLSGDGAEATVKPGKHTMTWDAKKDLGIFSSANFSMKIHAGERLPRYVVIDLSSGAESTEYPVRFSVVGPDLSNDVCRTTELWLRLVPPGEFWMGSPTDELGRSDNETLHHVAFTQPFYMGVFEVTQRQFELVMGDTGNSYFRSSANHAIRPVENTDLGKIRGGDVPSAKTGFDSSSFISKLRIRTENWGLDLPSESQWEYACRAGTMTALPNGKNLTDTTSSCELSEIAAYYANCHGDQGYDGNSIMVGTQRVGNFHPNALNLYDMLGNVREICRDNNHVWPADDCVDPNPVDVQLFNNSGSSSWRYYVIRGGGWRSTAGNVRSSRRDAWEGWSWSRDGNKISWHASDDQTGFRIFAETGF